MDIKDLERLLEEFVPSDRIDEVLNFVKEESKAFELRIEEQKHEIYRLDTMHTALHAQYTKLIEDHKLQTEKRERQILQEKYDAMMDLVKTVFRGPIPSSYHIQQSGNVPVWMPDPHGPGGFHSSQPYHSSGFATPTQP